MSVAAAFEWMNSRTERPGHEVAQDRFRLIADKIEADPSLLAIPLENIDRWLSQAPTSSDRWVEWRVLIQEAQRCSGSFQRLLVILRDDSPAAMILKGFSPFPGILGEEELERLSWNSAH